MANARVDANTPPPSVVNALRDTLWARQHMPKTPQKGSGRTPGNPTFGDGSGTFASFTEPWGEVVNTSHPTGPATKAGGGSSPDVAPCRDTPSDGSGTRGVREECEKESGRHDESKGGG